jgi:hypothetical protein
MRGHIRRRGAGATWELKFDAGRDDAGRRNIRYVTVKGTRQQAQAKLSATAAWSSPARSLWPPSYGSASVCGKRPATSRPAPRSAIAN